MKKSILILFTSLMAFSGFAQQNIDIVNAPLNPIGYIENKNQLNLKGDIAFCNIPEEGNVYFDKSGNRLFNLLYTLYTNKEKARINRGTYIELDNQKKVVYKENFYLENKTLYTYNSTGTISKIEVQGKFTSFTTYEYDNKKRLIKKIEWGGLGTTVTAYTYQTIGNSLVISATETVTENNQSKKRTFEYAYENGLLMKFTDGFEDNHTYTYDTKGNWVTNSFRFGNVNREFYYHSELGQWDKWRWIYKKTDTTYSPTYLMIGNRQIQKLTIGFNDLDNFTDILVYEPVTATYLVAENAVTTTGLTQGTGGGKISTMKAKNFMYTSVKGNIKFFVEGYNKSGNLKQVFIGKTYVIYDAGSSLTYWCRDFEEGKKFNVFEDLGKDAFLWYKNEKNFVYLLQKGEAVDAVGYTPGETLNDGSKLFYKNQKPALVLENFTSSTPNTLYKAIPYSGQAIPKTTTTAEASSLVAFSKNKPLYFKKITNAQVQFYQDETKITPPEKFFKSHSGDLIAYYEPGYYYIFSNVENATLNTNIKPNYQIANDFYYEVLSKDKTYVNRKGKYLKLSDFKLYVGANGVLNFMFPEEDVTYISNMGNGSLYSKYYSGGKFKGTDYLDIKKDKSFDLIRRGVRIPKSDYEVKVDIQNDNQAFIYYKGKKEFKISHYKSFFEQAYLRSITRVQ